MNNYYKLYIENTYTLAETIIVKFDDAAKALNLKVMANYGLASVSSDASTWKYYQNISGNYHFSDTFENGSNVITITSLDTLEQIEFTTLSLSLHPATKRAYSFGNRHYKQLVQKYPEQELLILGILYPCNISKALAAKDGTILNYPQYLIDPNEYSLIDKIQTWIYKYVDRWINKPFSISDDLYVATYLAQLYLHLVPAIINIRLQACKTNEAHSFHIREYLASNGMLDKYLDVMTINQSLFFYRNILYIQKNAGKRDTFDWLVENLMTVRSLPLYDFTMKHNVSEMITERKEFNSYYPDITFRRNPVNYKNIESSNTFVSLKLINSKIKDLAAGNALYLNNNQVAIKEQFEDSKSNVVGTKLLESLVSDYRLTAPYILEEILLNHWAYWCAENTYGAFVSITFIKTKKVVEMSVKDAFILLIYVLNKTVGLDLSVIPDVLATRILPLQKVNVSELRKITDSKYTSQVTLNAIHATVPEINTIDSIDAFYEKCREIYLSTLKQYRIEGSTEKLIQRGEIQAVISRLYIDKKINLGKENYSEWRNKFGLDFTSYDDVDFYDLAKSIIKESTGVNNKEDLSIRKLQTAMVEMLTLLSSYSINVISNSTEPPIVVVPRPSVRIGDELILENSKDYLNSAPLFIEGIKTTDKDISIFNVNSALPLVKIEGKEHSIKTIEIGIDVKSSKTLGRFDAVRIHLANIRVVDRTTFTANKYYVDHGNINVFDIQTKDESKNNVVQQDIRIMNITNTFFGGEFRGSLIDVPITMTGNPDALLILKGSFTPPLITGETNSLYFTTPVFGTLSFKPPEIVPQNNSLYFTTDIFERPSFIGKLVNVPIELTS